MKDLIRIGMWVDAPIVQEALEEALAKAGGFHTATVSKPPSAFDSPDVMLMLFADLELTGYGITADLHKRHRASKILLLTLGIPTNEEIHRSLEAGVQDFFPMTQEISELVDLIRYTVQSNKPYSEIQYLRQIGAAERPFTNLVNNSDKCIQMN